jgi:hypothetical protein
MKTLAWFALVVLMVIGAAVAVTRTIAVWRVLGGAPAAELSPLDAENQRQVVALLGIDERSERYRAIDSDMKEGSLKYNSIPVVMLLHAVPGGLFLLAAPLQLSARLRRRYAVVHRSLGYLLLLLAIPFALTGLYIAVRNPIFGPVGATGAVLLGLLFIHAGVRAYLAIRAGDRVGHRAWMLRFLALAYAIAVMRAQAMIAFVLLPVTMHDIGAPLFWISWILTAIAAEWWIRRTSSTPIIAAPPAPVLS